MMNFYKIPRNFFFYWSGQDFQYVNYLCASSLLKTNKIEKCEVYYNQEPRQNDNWEKLRKMDQVRLVKLNYDELFKISGQNKEDFNDFFDKATINHQADFFRYLILYCYGGVYLDFDMLITKDLKPLLNTGTFLGFQSYHNSPLINGAIIGATKRSFPIKMCLDELVRYVRINKKLEWNTLGPDLLSSLFYPKAYLGKIIMNLFERLSRIKWSEQVLNILLNNLSQYRRLNLRIYPRHYFYPYPCTDWEKIFQENHLPKDTYTVHCWGKFSCEFTSSIDAEHIKNDNSLYSNLTKGNLADNLESKKSINVKKGRAKR